MMLDAGGRKLARTYQMDPSAIRAFRAEKMGGKSFTDGPVPVNGTRCKI
jgi:hypothetical protein